MFPLNQSIDCVIYGSSILALWRGHHPIGINKLGLIRGLIRGIGVNCIWIHVGYRISSIFIYIVGIIGDSTLMQTPFFREYQIGQ